MIEILSVKTYQFNYFVDIRRGGFGFQMARSYNIFRKFVKWLLRLKD